MGRNIILATLLAAAVCVGNVCVAVPPEEPTPWPVARRKALDAPEPPAPVLVDKLDRGIQARFRDVRDEDIHNGELGTSRVAFLGYRHGGILRRELRDELQTLDQISSAGWRSAVYVAGAPGTKWKRDSIKGPIVARAESWEMFQGLDGIEEVALRAMIERAAARGTGSGVALEARPVLASEAKCLQCHRRKKVGDPLGAVVYAFREEPLAAMLGIGR